MSSPTSYVGTSKVSSTEKYSFMATICQGAYEAMKRGATKGIVTFVIRPRNRSSGIGFGGTGGGSGLPTGVLATHPYALAGALGFGTGWARAYSEGELMMHIVALRETKAAAPKLRVRPTASAPAPQVADKPRDDAERARERATEQAWFGAPAAGQPQCRDTPASAGPGQRHDTGRFSLVDERADPAGRGEAPGGRGSHPGAGGRQGVVRRELYALIRSLGGGGDVPAKRSLLEDDEPVEERGEVGPILLEGGRECVGHDLHCPPRTRSSSTHSG